MHTEHVYSEVPPPHKPNTALIGSMDHVLDILSSHHHPMILVGMAASRWMGSNVILPSACDLLIRDDEIDSVTSALIRSGHWNLQISEPQDFWTQHYSIHRDADVLLQTTANPLHWEYSHLRLYSESSYRLSVDTSPLIHVPDVYPWKTMLIEEDWHPANNRTDDYWYGPHVHPTSKLNYPEGAALPTAFPPGLPRGISPIKTNGVYIPTLSRYLDSLIYHKTQYRDTKRGLSMQATWLIENLVRYLFLELSHQRLPLLAELKEGEYMDAYLERYIRKPFYVYGTVKVKSESA
jgi:hypothetical protein